MHHVHRTVTHPVTVCWPTVAVLLYLHETGRQVAAIAADGGRSTACDGSDVAALVLTDPVTQETTRLERNEAGSFYRIFQPNKWVLKKQKEKEEAERAAALVT